MSFQIVSGQPANIYITFVPTLDNDPGEFGILAIADSPAPFRPPPGSMIRFDAREPWVEKWTPSFTGMRSDRSFLTGTPVIKNIPGTPIHHKIMIHQIFH